MILLSLLACESLKDSVTMTATVWDAPYQEGGVVAGAEVEVTDETQTVFDSQVSDADGVVTVNVPAGVQFFVTVRADGYVPTAFSGTAGIADFTAPDGYPWVATPTWVDALRAEFSACPTVNDAGGVVAGEIVGDLPSYPTLATGSARLYGPDDVELTACYLDDDGNSSADATVAGETGRFAIFGVPAGEVVVDVHYDTGTGEDPVELYRFFAPEDGVTPVFPAILPVL